MIPRWSRLLGMGGPPFNREGMAKDDEGRWVLYSDVVNDDCVWGEGECIPDCPSCKRMDELYAERVAGAREERERIRRFIVGLTTTEHTRHFAETILWHIDKEQS